MSSAACCTCASLLPISSPPSYDSKSLSRFQFSRELPCCTRTICSTCLATNPRFQTYCPFCQISTHPSPLPSTGLREPPSYSPPAPAPQSAPSASSTDDAPPPYSLLTSLPTTDQKPAKHGEDVLHFIDPERDTLPSLSLRYSVPISVLRSHNNLFSDHLLHARRTILIPGAYYSGASLSPRPVEGEEEELRKSKVRRFMVATKEVEWDVARVYLEGAGWRVEEAVERWRGDEMWERSQRNGNAANGKGRQSRKGSGRRWWRAGVGGGLTGQFG